MDVERFRGFERASETASTSELTEFYQDRPQGRSFRMVDPKHSDRGPANRRQRQQFRSIPNEVLGPLVIPRMEQRSYSAGSRVDS